jgi:linoleoyl-CoA desaturase
MPGSKQIEDSSSIEEKPTGIIPTQEKSIIIIKPEPKKLWTIHGKKYDLTEFIAKHPGGRQVLERARDMEDSGVMFEIYHAFSNKEAIKKQLEKYEVTDCQSKTTNTPVYNFKDYSELVQRVKAKFPDRKSIKATPLFWLKNFVIFILFIVTYYLAMFSHMNTLIRTIIGFISGWLWVSIGFNIMHDGSHYAISANPKVNQFLESFWNSFSLWNSYIWHLHHVYGHHSFTGDTTYDPDMKHYRPFVKKYKSDKTILGGFRNYNEKVFLFIAMVFPGMYTGQLISYLFATFKGKLWGVKLSKNIFTVYKFYEACLALLSVYSLYKGLWLPSISYLIANNIAYHINIAGDHDTFESSVENRDDKTDNWVKMQICHTANFYNDNKPWTHIFGGINFQIEHHLFPNMSHMHYGEIKSIVVDFCKEKGYPYAEHKTLWDSYKSFLKNMQYQASN